MGGELAGQVSLGGGGEGFNAGEVAKLEFGVVVAVAHDVRVVALAAPRHADVERRGSGSWCDDDVPTVNRAALGAGDVVAYPKHHSLAT